MGRWFSLARLALTLLGVVFFFTLYNRFILDVNLRNLKTSLTVLNAATGVGQAEAALFLVDQTLSAEMALEEPDPKRVAALQYAQGTLSGDQLRRPIEDAQLMVATVAQEQQSAHPAFFQSMDRAVTGLQGTTRALALLPRRAPRGALSETTDTLQLQEAIRLERLGRPQEAAALYEKLLQAYPYYSKRSALFLRAGSVHQRMQEFDQAERSFREGLKAALHLPDRLAAEQKLERLGQARQNQRRAKQMERRLARVSDRSERQQVGFQLGGLWIRADDMGRASRAFHEAALADPEGHLFLPSLFKEAWCLKNLGRLDEALERLQAILHQEPEGTWGSLAFLQAAEVYKAQGNYRAAAESYEQMISSAPDASFAAIGHAHAGFAYLIDLRNPDKGLPFLQRLENHYPASPFSNAFQMFRNLQKAKGLTLPRPIPSSLPPAPAPQDDRLEAGSPIVRWLEDFLPIFVEVFAERLARYMQVIGETSLTRRFTEEEFRELVVRRIEQRFPRQISYVVTKIRPDGFFGSGTVKLGILQFQVAARLGIALHEERPHVEVHEVRVGNIPIPAPLLKFLEQRVNQRIDQKQYPLQVKQYDLRDGYALISVELTETH